MVEKPKIGVVTVTYNSGGVLREFLRCTFKQTFTEFTVYAVDNGSTDETAVILKTEPDPRLRCILNADNVGVAEGNNQGIGAALEDGCSMVMLINNDTEFGPSLFSSLIEGLEEHGVEMCCPKMMYFDEPKRIWAAGGAFQPWLGYRINHLGGDKIDMGQYDRAKLVTYVPTCCVLIKREVFQAVGLMDQRYFVYFDDVDFMYRAMKKSVKLLYFPKAQLLHKVGHLTGREDSTFAARYCTRNRVYFMLQHFGLLRAIPVLLAYQLYFTIGVLYGRFSPNTFRIKQRALLEGITMWKEVCTSK